eukprot:760055-Hanusia_phi.AAC.1
MASPAKIHGFLCPDILKTRLLRIHCPISSCSAQQTRRMIAQLRIEVWRVQVEMLHPAPTQKISVTSTMKGTRCLGNYLKVFDLGAARYKSNGGWSISGQEEDRDRDTAAKRSRPNESNNEDRTRVRIWNDEGDEEIE